MPPFHIYFVQLLTQLRSQCRGRKHCKFGMNPQKSDANYIQPMNPTWCMAFPTGYETGTYLALDMGGTNLRVCEIILTEEKSEFDIIQSKYRMPEELKSGTSDELWEYIADCLQQFIESHHQDEKLGSLPLGFTFSYPATQDYIDHGVLQRWTKGFDIDGVEGKNVVPMFEAAIAKRVSLSLASEKRTVLTRDREHPSNSPP